MDNHTFTHAMYSPRATLIYTPTEQDTAKVILSRSVRTGQAADMKLAEILTGKNTRPEKLKAFELRYERQQTEHLMLAASGFFHDHDITSYNFAVGFTTPLGNVKTWGFEAEAIYTVEDTRLIFSHAFTKLKDWDPEPGLSDAQVISSEHVNFGNDLANWSNHITKLAAHQQLGDRLSLDASVRAYWGYPGFKSYARWNEAQFAPWIPRAASSQFRPSFFTSLGVEYECSDNMILRLDGHDLLGFFDHDVNQRLYGFYMEGDTRSTTPSFTLSLTYKF
jgi:outer membrane receptor protein involved in Fe transport